MNKSYLKWAGGKGRILDDVLATFPTYIDTFYEPFVGSGTVALNVQAKEKLLSDFNPDLINCHKQVRDVPDKVLVELDQLYKQGRDDYYLLRDEFNRTSQGVRKAALFIYLNKHGFNGMCRYNAKGNFNIPVGKSKTINFPKKEILEFSKWLGSAKFAAIDFATSMDLAGKDDVVYCDPPYVPASVTLSDINYTGNGFPLKEQQRLVEAAESAKTRGAKVIISNHDTDVTRDLYKGADKILKVEAWRSISSKNDTRGKVGELLAIYGK